MFFWLHLPPKNMKRNFYFTITFRNPCCPGHCISLVYIIPVFLLFAYIDVYHTKPALF